MAELRIPIIGEFRGKKAFDQAGKATSTLDKSVKRLGKTLLGVFGAQQMMRYAKNGVAAFAENEKSARRLETVVKNLGLAFETPAIEASLDRMSAKFGFEGEVLREAFQKLITSTGSALKAQELLNASLDIAAGSGVDLLTVNQDLAAAYVGQTRGLRKYNLGLTQAQLKTLKFDDALDLLTGSFKGAAGAELETYSGQMRVLQEASDNAQEIIGGGLIDSLMILSGDTSVEDLAKSMTELAESTSVALTQLSTFGKGVKDIFGGIATVVEKFILATDPFVDLIVEGDPSGFMDRPRARAGRFFAGGQDSILEAQRNKARAKAEADRLKAEAARLKLEKQRAALEKQRLAREKQQNALLKASQTLDLERISIAAALKGQISETDRLSLSLQLALLNQNDEAATKLSGLLTEAVKRQNELNALLLATPKAPNPYSEWKVPKLDFGGNLLGSPVPNFVPPSFMMPTPPTPTPTATETLAVITADTAAAVIVALTETAESLGVAAETILGGGSTVSATEAIVTATEEVAKVITELLAQPDYTAIQADATLELIEAFKSAQAAQVAAEKAAAVADRMGNVNIIVELDGAVVGNAIKDSTLNSSLSGSFSEVNRVDRFRATPR